MLHWNSLRLELTLKGKQYMRSVSNFVDTNLKYGVLLWYYYCAYRIKISIQHFMEHALLDFLSEQ